MRAKSLNQPNASLVTIGVQRFITATHAAEPGRILIHATQRKPDIAQVGDYWVDRFAFNEEWGMWRGDARTARIASTALRLGAIVGSATIEACYPIVDRLHWRDDVAFIYKVGGRLWLRPVGADVAGRIDISDQLPYGDWAAGRYAWLLTDAASTSERCPACWGEGFLSPRGDSDPCPTCNNRGGCDPIPARGKQRVWYWDSREATT